MPRILVAGGTGLLGTALAPTLKAAGHEVVCAARSSLADVVCDFENEAATFAIIDATRPNIVINLAALTNVDLCEADPNRAYRANILSVQHLCAAIQSTSCRAHFIQVSTDMVYDGAGPHSEDCVTIRNIYALSKLTGELIAQQVPATILRTNFVGRSRVAGRSSLTDWLFASLRKRVAINVFEDVFFSPLSITTLCTLISGVVINRPTGLYNLGSRNGLSKADFAFEFARALGQRTDLLARTLISSSDAVAARRPRDMRMDCSRFGTVSGLTLPTLTDEIQVIAKEYHG